MRSVTPVFAAIIAAAAAHAEVNGTAAPTPEQYVVQPGDTLWQLSQRFLNNPWYWPKLWSFNQEIDNPNWIRPGTVLRFYPAADGPAIVDVDEPDEPADDDDRPPLADPIPPIVTARPAAPTTA